MQRCSALLSVAVMLVVLTGCARTRGAGADFNVGGLFSGWGMPAALPVNPPPGFIYDHVEGPLMANYNATPASPGKTGETTVTYIGFPYILGGILTFSMDDASIATAARNGGITEVEYADFERRQILGVFGEFTVRAYGR